MTKTLADKFDVIAEANKIETENFAKKHLEAMETETEKLCDYFLDAEFDVTKMLMEICNYLSAYNRLLYSVISNKIFTLDDKSISIFQGNIDKLLEYVWNNDFESEPKCRDKDETIKVIIKLRDHVNLARRQLLSLKAEQEDDMIRFAPLKEEITKDMSAQLITLVGIFTALAFLVFGEMSSLSVVFNDIKNVSILRLIIIGTAWSLFLMNTIFVFMYCLQKITTLDMRANKNPDATLIQQYPMVWWTNLVLIGLLLVLGWANIATQKCLVESLNWLLITGDILKVFFVFLLGIALHEKTK